jgi:hypothetical protein
MTGAGRFESFAEPVAEPADDPASPSAQERWHGALVDARSRHYAQVLDRVAALATAGHSAPVITRVLQREGYTMAPGRADLISLTAVRRLLRENIRPLRSDAADGSRGPDGSGCGLGRDEWWLRDLAAELSMPSITLYGWARRGWVTIARKESRPPYRLILRADRAELDRLRSRRPCSERLEPGRDSDA